MTEVVSFLGQISHTEYRIHVDVNLCCSKEDELNANCFWLRECDILTQLLRRLCL
jgi:hypothetical protein